MKNLKLSLMLTALVAVPGGVLFFVPGAAEAAHTRTIKVRVDKDGFSPSSIEAEAGHKINLVFNRADKNNCGSTVVLPKLKIRKNLPFGRDVVVSVTPTQSGQISFTCGTGAHKGSIVVSEG